MPSPWYAVKAEGSAPVSVSVRGLIGEWGLSDRDFIREIEALGDVKEIEVSINSRGGEVDHALAIFNYLSAHPATVIVRIDGLAASAASIIALAGDEIRMPANALIMVHNPWTFAAGNASELHRVAEDLEKVETALLETYMGRTGQSEVDLREMLNRETYMTAAEAVELGFADVVEPIVRRAAAAMAEALEVPETVLAQLNALEAQPEAEPVVEPDTAAETPTEGLPVAEAPAVETPATEAPAAEAPLATAQPSPAAIATLCHEHGFSAMAGAWINEGISEAECRTRVLAAKSAADTARVTNSTIAEPVVSVAKSVWDKVLNRTAS